MAKNVTQSFTTLDQSEEKFLFPCVYKRKRKMTLNNAEWYGLYRGRLYRNGKFDH